MSTLAILLIVLAILVVLFLVGGLLGARRRDIELAPTYQQHLREADHALEEARAADRGWDRGLMESVVRDALAEAHPGVAFNQLDLVLVDDQPGIDRDRAHFEGLAGERRVEVVLVRDESGWHADRSG